MIRIKVAILDADSTYVERLATAFNTNYQDKIEVYSFSDKNLALDAIDKNNIEVLIASERFEISAIEISSKCAFAYFTEINSVETVNGEKAICKYQKVDLIYKEILAIFSEKSNYSVSINGDAANRTPIKAFIAFAGGVGTSTVAVAYATRCSNQGKKVSSSGSAPSQPSTHKKAKKEKPQAGNPVAGFNIPGVENTPQPKNSVQPQSNNKMTGVQIPANPVQNAVHPKQTNQIICNNQQAQYSQPIKNDKPIVNVAMPQTSPQMHQPENNGFGGTSVLGVSGPLDTTVLGSGAIGQPVMKNPRLIRSKNNETILINKPIFRIGKERKIFQCSKKSNNYR